MIRLVRYTAVVMVLMIIAGCSLPGRTPPEQVLISVCREFVIQKTTVANAINLDAQRPAHARRFDYQGLAAIKAANDQLNGFCPPPEGFAPYSLTIKAAKSALAVLVAHSGPEEVYRR